MDWKWKLFVESQRAVELKQSDVRNDEKRMIRWWELGSLSNFERTLFMSYDDKIMNENIDNNETTRDDRPQRALYKSFDV